MTDSFDPYHKWLAIVPRDQPPNHYRLLGIDLFESDPDVISAAAEQRMAHVRTYQLGSHSALSQKILNEISAAKICLLVAEKKAAYDEKLREEIGLALRAAVPVATAAAPPVAAPAAGVAPIASEAQTVGAAGRFPRRKRWWQAAPARLCLLGGAAACLMGLMFLFVGRDSHAPQPETGHNQSPVVAKAIPKPIAELAKEAASTESEAERIALELKARSEQGTSSETDPPVTAGPAVSELRDDSHISESKTNSLIAGESARGTMKSSTESSTEVQNKTPGKAEIDLTANGYQVWLWKPSNKSSFKLWLHDNGLVGRAAPIKGSPSDSRFTWKNVGSAVVVRWPQGWVDTMVISADGRGMVGKNQHGIPITAQFISDSSGSPISTSAVDSSETAAPPPDSDTSEPARADASGQTGTRFRPTAAMIRYRQTLEWVLRNGGKATVILFQEGDPEVLVDMPSKIPEERFLITGILLYDNPSITDAHLLALLQLDGLNDLRELKLFGTGITDAGLAHVAGMKKLEELYLGRTGTTDRGLQHLRGLSNLRFLGLSHTQVSDGGMIYLAALKKLERMNLSATRVSDAAVKRVLPRCVVERPN